MTWLQCNWKGSTDSRRLRSPKFPLTFRLVSLSSTGYRALPGLACFLSILLSLTAVWVSPALASDDTCADRSIVASAVRTEEDIQTFVQCAYEFVQEVGFEEARRAFNEDARWRSGPTYIFVAEVAPLDQARLFVFPPDTSREGSTLGVRIDAFGNNFREDRNRIVSSYGEGWNYYSFRNPATDREGPKASYVKGLDWDGNPAAIGAGIYRRDLPGTCEAEEVNASLFESDPSNGRLQEFVRCAAMELEANGYFAIGALSSHPRWRNQSIYLFGLDANGTPLFSGNPYSQLWWGGLAPELTDQIDGPFGGRDVVSVGDAFGETFLYYSTRNPFTGMTQGKAAFVKRVVISGLPILIGSGYYLDGEEGP